MSEKKGEWVFLDQVATMSHLVIIDCVPPRDCDTHNARYQRHFPLPAAQAHALSL
jgi:hypothetical protein